DAIAQRQRRGGRAEEQLRRLQVLLRVHLPDLLALLCIVAGDQAGDAVREYLAARNRRRRPRPAAEQPLVGGARVRRQPQLLARLGVERLQRFGVLAGKFVVQVQDAVRDRRRTWVLDNRQ